MGNEAAMEVMLQDAQDRVSGLMTELYAKRRELWETQQALNQAVAQRDTAVRRTQELEQYAKEMQASMQRIPSLESEQQQLRDSNNTLQIELSKLKDANRSLLADLEGEKFSRKKAEEGKTWAEAERARLQRSRDDLALRLKVAESRLKEAEDEQIRAEQDLAAAHVELRAERSGTGNSTETSGASALSSELELFHQLEHERARSSAILSALDHEKTKSASLAADVETLREKVRELQEAMQAHPQSQAPPIESHSTPQNDGSDATGPPHAPGDKEGGPTTSGADASGARRVRSDDNLQLYELQVKVVSLKRTRDKLLAQLDAQAAEIDRLVNENVALQTGVDAARDTSLKWEDQLQESLSQNERLKELLEESVNWTGQTSKFTPTKQTQQQANESPEAATDTGTGDANDAALQLEKKLTEERARVAELDLQVRALCAELTRASQNTAQINQSILPMLNSIESRLEAVTRLSASKSITA